MAKIPDPFEPWRPPGDKPSPPVPAPTVREQPILTPPARVAPAPRTVSLLAPVFLAAVAILGLIMLIVHPQGHAPRVLGAVALLGVGLGLGLLFAHKRRWRAALIWASGGMVAAVLAWVFVPTTQGLSLWGASSEAERLTTDLQALPPGDLVGHGKESQARAQLVQLYPSFQRQLEDAAKAWGQRSLDLCLADLAKAPPGDVKAFQEKSDLRRGLTERLPNLAAQLRKAEEGWAERSAEVWAAELDRLLPGDHEGLQRLRTAYRPFLHARLAKRERVWLEQTFAILKPGDFAAARQARTAAESHCALWPAVEASFYRPWATAWAGRTAEAAVLQAKGLQTTDPGTAAAQLRAAARDLDAFGTYAEAQKILFAARRQAVLAWFDAVRQEARTLLAKDRFEEVAELARRFEEQAREDALAVGEGNTLARLREQYGFFVDLSRSVFRGSALRLLALAPSPANSLPSGLTVAAWLQPGWLEFGLPRK